MERFIKKTFKVFLIIDFTAILMFNLSSGQEGGSNNKGLLFEEQMMAGKIEEYKMMLESKKAKDRLDAIYELGKIKVPDAGKVLIEHYKKEKDNYLKIQIIEVLSMFSSSESQKIVLDAMHDSNAEVRKSAWMNVPEQFVLSKNELKEIKGVIKKEKDRGVKLIALKKLALDKSSETVKDFSLVIEDEKEDIEVRKLALKLVSEMGIKEAKKEIDRQKKNPRKEISELAKKLEKK